MVWAKYRISSTRLHFKWARQQIGRWGRPARQLSRGCLRPQNFGTPHWLHMRMLCAQALVLVGKGLPQLCHLRVGMCVQVRDGGLRQLKPLTRLASLDISG